MGQARGQELAGWCKAEGDWMLEVGEHMFGWLSRSRRGATMMRSARFFPCETFIQVAMVRSLLLQEEA